MNSWAIGSGRSGGEAPAKNAGVDSHAESPIESDKPGNEGESIPLFKTKAGAGNESCPRFCCFGCVTDSH